MVYWNSHADNKNNKITKVLLCGKNGAIKGFDSYLATQVKTHVELANVWTNVFDFNVSVPRIEFTESLNYALAIGLTLGEFYKKYV